MSNMLAAEGRSSVTHQTSLLRAFGIVYATALVMILFDVADGVRYIKDVDDQLRELQIRFLMSPQGHWFDLTLPFIAMPEPYVTPWSRLIDLPYVTIAWLLRPLIPVPQALTVAFQLWPPILLSGFCLLVASTVRRLVVELPLSQIAFAVSLMLMTMLMSLGILEFSPGRIDHHNVQIVAMMMVVAGLVRWDRVGGIMIGVGSTLSTVIGLECLPFVVIAYAGLVVCYIAGVATVRAVIVYASAAMIFATVLSGLVFIGPGGFVSTQCDTFSAPYIFLLCGFASILAASIIIRAQGMGPIARILSLQIPAVALLGVAAFLFPSCLAGPYAIIDPLSREHWFNRIWQEKSILYFYQNGQYDLLVLVAFTITVAFAVVPFVLVKARRGLFGPAIVYLVALGALVLTLCVTRNIRFPIALMPVFLPGAIAMMANSYSFKGSYRICASAAVGVIAVMIGLYFWIRPVVPEFDAVDYMAFSECEGQDFSVLDIVPAGRIAAPQGIALPILFSAPAGFSVGATPFHRSSPGMKRMFEAFLSSDASVRRQALAPFDYVAVCRFALKADPAQAPLYAALAGGGGWPGLERVQPPAPIQTNFQLFRIDHSTLQ